MTETPKESRFSRLTRASLYFGDRAAEYRSSATYAIWHEGVIVGVISNRGDGGYRSAARWEIAHWDSVEHVAGRCIIGCLPTLREAKQIATRRLERAGNLR